MNFSIQASRWTIAIAMAMFCLTGAFAQTATTTTKVSVEVTNVVDVIGDGKIDWTKEELRARGIGVAPKYAKSPGQITALAREAAIVAAERNLLKVISGVHITSKTTVENLELTQDIIKTSVKGLLRGAVIISEKPFGSDGYEVVLAVKLYGKSSSLSDCIDLSDQFQAANPGATVATAPAHEEKNSTTAVEPAQQTPPAETLPVTETPVETAPVTQTPPEELPVVQTPLATVQSSEAYTGLLIDCRGLGLSRSMCPHILDQSNANLWVSLKVSEDEVNERGIAGYFTSPDDPTMTKRVGKHPLIVKALRVGGGKVYKTDAILSAADAELVRAENNKVFFLDNLNVGFLVDK